MTTSADPATTRGSKPKRVLLLGATGTIGQATRRALVEHGHDVVCFMRPRKGDNGDTATSRLNGMTIRFGDVTDAASFARDAIRGEPFDAIVSCLAWD